MGSSGILMHISSLPSPYGIGNLGSDAFLFVDFLEKTGQEYWQILPQNPTGFGDSPYQSSSAFAGNPYFVDIDALVEEGLLMQDEVDNYFFGDDPEKIDYEKLFFYRYPLLRCAFFRFKKDEKWTMILTTKDKEDMLKFSNYLFKNKIKHIANHGLSHQGEETIHIIAFSKTKAESKLIEKYLQKSDSKYLKEII